MTPQLLGLVRRQAEVRGASLATVRIPSRSGMGEPWPSWVPAELRDALASRGVQQPWGHQVSAASLAHQGNDVIVATGTGSGKSLAYQLPMITRLIADPRATALYLAPTKALARDQLRTLNELGTADATDACVLDGDTPRAVRDWARGHARLLLSNPDMLHASLLPRHERWSRFLRHLTFVVIDECHHYTGVFGSHVALVLRRLTRLAQRQGARPVFVLASATVSEPEVTASTLIGRPVRATTHDSAPRSQVDLAVWVPGPRRAPGADAAWLLARLVSHRARTLAFVRSRAGAERVAREARALLARDNDPGHDRIAPYRAGLLPEQRRAVESALLNGKLWGVASTNALELGIDVSGLDAVVMEGFPGTMASLRQQMGRAGRGSRAAVAVMVARADPLDRFLAAEPAMLVQRPVERVTLNPANPRVLTAHLLSAIEEGPWTQEDTGRLCDPSAEASALGNLERQRLVRRRPAGWFRTARRTAVTSLRSSPGSQISIVDSSSGQLLGTVETHAAPRTVHEGAVYLHAGAVFQVESLDLSDGVALVSRGDPGWTTHPRSSSAICMGPQRTRVDAGPVTLGFGEVTVSSRVVGYLRRNSEDGSVIDEHPLVLPESRLTTDSVWYTIAPEAVSSLGIGDADLPGGVHAAEHAAIGLLPLVASCDRRDVGGLSTVAHEQTGLPTVFVYDGIPGGAGIAERGFEIAGRWLHMTRDVVDACSCRSGCPSCVQSPQCGSANHPLSKSAAVGVLGVAAESLENA